MKSKFNLFVTVTIIKSNFCFQVDGKYSQHPEISSKIFKLSIHNTKFNVRKDLLTWCLFLPLIWWVSFDEKLCKKDRIDWTCLKERLRFMVSKYKSQTYIAVGQESVSCNMLKLYVNVCSHTYDKYLLNHKVDLFPIYASQSAIASVLDPKNWCLFR
jgi:hypothetical protein